MESFAFLIGVSAVFKKCRIFASLVLLLLVWVKKFQHYFTFIDDIFLHPTIFNSHFFVLVQTGVLSCPYSFMTTVEPQQGILSNVSMNIVDCWLLIDHIVLKPCYAMYLIPHCTSFILTYLYKLQWTLIALCFTSVFDCPSHFCIPDWGEWGLTGPLSDFSLLILFQQASFDTFVCDNNSKGLLVVTCLVAQPPSNSVCT